MELRSPEICLLSDVQDAIEGGHSVELCMTSLTFIVYVHRICNSSPVSCMYGKSNILGGVHWSVRLPEVNGCNRIYT
jgi:hypothetical protein